MWRNLSAEDLAVTVACWRLGQARDEALQEALSKGGKIVGYAAIVGR